MARRPPQRTLFDPTPLTARQWRRRRRTRRALTVVLAVALLVALAGLDRLGAFGRARPGDYDRYHNASVRVVRIVDGDTLDIDLPDDDRPRTRIRLWGVDTPETKKPNSPVQHFGPEASAYTRRTAHGKTVRLELLPHRTRDKYGRLLAYVYLPDDTMLNRQLIITGHGFADPRFKHPHKRTFAELMKHARDEQVGLWQAPVEADLPYYLKK